MRIENFAGRLTGEEVTIVAGGKTTVDYSAVVRTKNVILINYALNLAPLFPNQTLFHVTLHPEILCSHPNLRLDNVIPIVGEWWSNLVPKDIEDKSLLYRTKQFPDLEAPELAMTARDLAAGSKSGVLCHVANSSHCAIHLTWLWGGRRLRIVGASEYKGLPTSGYDERLNVPEPIATQITSAQYYISSFRRFVGLLDWDDVVYAGY
ncbi:MAG: hypothetical protein V4719_07505 [Planctomycetota bacterium]